MEGKYHLYFGFNKSYKNSKKKKIERRPQLLKPANLFTKKSSKVLSPKY
jgi:hypothetical protein